MAAEVPYKITVSDNQVALVRQKLELATLPDELDSAGWDYGVPLADIRKLVAYWKDGYDWRKYEAKLNEIPQFTRDITIEGHGTLNIHYVHQKSSVVDAIPLLFVHGWPGSFIEVVKLLPLLTEASADHPSFNVVALSLPGYGFSEAPRKPGFSTKQYAELGNSLMIALGYNEYVTQGGDWGYMIIRQMAFTYGHRHVKAWQTNFPLTSAPSFFQDPLSYIYIALGLNSERERTGLERTKWVRNRAQGYLHQQATQPQTLGYGLADSPVGLLAWIYEKLHNWTDSYPWTDDEVLNWVSIYLFSRSGPAASLRIYYEFFRGNMSTPLPSTPNSTIPLGLSYFPKELASLPRSWVRRIGNVVAESEHEKGGHFASWECPRELAGDLFKMFAKGGPAYGVVPGRAGYA